MKERHSGSLDVHFGEGTVSAPWLTPSTAVMAQLDPRYPGFLVTIQLVVDGAQNRMIFTVTPKHRNRKRPVRTPCSKTVWWTAIQE